MRIWPVSKFRVISRSRANEFERVAPREISRSRASRFRVAIPPRVLTGILQRRYNFRPSLARARMQGTFASVINCSKLRRTDGFYDRNSPRREIGRTIRRIRFEPFLFSPPLPSCPASAAFGSRIATQCHAVKRAGCATLRGRAEALFPALAIEMVARSERMSCWLFDGTIRNERTNS